MPQTEPSTILLSPVRALIVDDEVPGRTNLRLALSEYAGWSVIGECEDAPSARRALEATSCDVVFLDIQMPKESGIDLARSICVRPDPPLIVFVTAYSQFALEAFDVHAIDYLLKPLDDERVAQTVERVRALLGRNERANYARAVRDYMDEAETVGRGEVLPFLKRVSVRSVGKIEAVDLGDVHWIGSAGNYVELHAADRTILHRIALSRFEPRLDPAVFLRIHRTAIVRRDQVRALHVIGDGVYELVLHGGATLPVSARHLSAVRALIESSDR